MVSKGLGIGLVSGAAGVVAAGAAVVLAVDRSVAKKRRLAPDVNLNDWAVDRSGRVVADDGVGLYYEELGPTDAPLTVVFVHGYCLHMGEFVFQRDTLAADDRRLVFFDQRSHGRSDRSDSGLDTIDQLGRDLGTVLDTLAPDGSIVLIGHSMGGMALMALAEHRPELFAAGAEQRVTAVALVSTSAGKLAGVTLGLPAMLAKVKGPLLPLLLRGARRQADLVERGRKLGTDIAWVFTRKLSFAGADVDPATVEYLTSMIASTRIEVVADFYPAIMNHDKLDALKVLSDVPVLVLCGDRDLLTPVEHSEQIAETLTESELVVVPEAGHMVPMERPDVVNEAFARLIEAAGSSSSGRRWWRRR